MSVRVRFAPSPTGHLHVGNVRTALYNWLFARQNRGVFILRVEDTDLARSEKRFEQQLLEDLRWLGLTWDEGIDVGGAHGPYRQTDRFGMYQDQALRLLREGAAYHCFCSSEELEAERTRQIDEGLQPRYSGKCRLADPASSAERVAAGEPATIRLRVREGRVGFEDMVFGTIEVDCDGIGDFILLRSDGSAQYNFAVVVDDVSMEITHVVRGEGHISNTHRQLLLYEALRCEPPRFAHLSTILGKDGAKLSKRHGATSIDEFKRQGYPAAALLNYLALLGWAPREEGREILTIDELVSEFDLARVNRHPAVFDPEKLNWVSRSHIREIPLPRLVSLALPCLQAQGWVPAQPSDSVREWLESVLEAVLNYLDKIEDVIESTRLIFDFQPDRDLKQGDVEEVLAHPGSREVLTSFLETVSGRDLAEVSFRDVVAQVKAATGKKGKELFHPIRIAVTARTSGPELEKLVPILEKGSRLGLPAGVAGVQERARAVLESLS